MRLYLSLPKTPLVPAVVAVLVALAPAATARLGPIAFQCWIQPLKNHATCTVGAFDEFECTVSLEGLDESCGVEPPDADCTVNPSSADCTVDHEAVHCKLGTSLPGAHCFLFVNGGDCEFLLIPEHQHVVCP